jgi:hypothetical protein
MGGAIRRPAPVRMNNLVKLDIERNLVRPGLGKALHIGFYTGLGTLAAVRHLDKTILDLRNLNGIKLRKGTKGIHANWSRQRK